MTRADTVKRGATRPIASRARSFAKAISWRAAGSLATFVLTFAITGSSTLAGSITLIEVIAKTAFYYFHERLWSTVAWGRPSAKLMD